MKVGDLIRGDYTAVIPEDMPRKIWLGIIVAVDDVDNWVEILWDDGERYTIYLDWNDKVLFLLERRYRSYLPQSLLLSIKRTDFVQEANNRCHS